MSIGSIRGPNQGGRFLILLPFIICLSSLTACRRSTEELPVSPPATHPLAREFIGFAVVNASFAHLFNEPGPQGQSLSYLRRGTVLRVLERRMVTNRGNLESWLLAEANYQEGASVSQGWLPEATIEFFTAEAQAHTASRAMGP